MRPRAPSLPAPASGSPETARVPLGVDYRDEMPTYSDPVELEAARVKSTLTSTPPPAGSPRPATEELTQAERLAVFELRLGGFHRVPVVVVAPQELASRALDSRASMLVALLDGRSTIQNILDIRIVNTLDTLAGLSELLEHGIIELRD